MLTADENNCYWNNSGMPTVVTPVVVPSTSTPLPSESVTVSSLPVSASPNIPGQAREHFYRIEQESLRQAFDNLLSPLIRDMDATVYNSMLDDLARLVRTTELK